MASAAEAAIMVILNMVLLLFAAGVLLTADGAAASAAFRFDVTWLAGVELRGFSPSELSACFAAGHHPLAMPCWSSSQAAPWPRPETVRQPMPA
jgi:hypothetical protein